MYISNLSFIYTLTHFKYWSTKHYKKSYLAGFLIDFVSGPVSSGFTSAVALIILTSQVKDVLGIQASGSTFVGTWKSIFDDIHNTQAWDSVLGIVCIAVLLILRVSNWRYD